MERGDILVDGNGRKYRVIGLSSVRFGASSERLNADMVEVEH